MTYRKLVVMKEKICVYTCITGNYDNLQEIENKEKEIDYYCFTNNKNIKSNTWKIIYIEDEKLSNVKLARKIKILGHPIINENYDILLWMDGAVVFKKKIKDFIKKYLSKDDNLVAFKHGERNSIKDECDACIRFRKETKENIRKILKFYEKENYHHDNGLIESTVYIKRTHNDLVDSTMQLWFDMILNYSKRDQLSFNYCIHKTGLRVKWINEKVFDNEWFNWNVHNENKEIKAYRVYFGDEGNYTIENDIQGDYNIKDNQYSFTIEIPNDVDYAIINITDVRLVSFDNIKIKGINSKEYDVYNYINYNDLNVFYNNNSVIKINKRLKKGSNLEFSINMSKLKENDINQYIDKISQQNIILSKEKEIATKELKVKQEYINNLYKTINGNIICRIVFKIKRVFGNNKL